MASILWLCLMFAGALQSTEADAMSPCEGGSCPQNRSLSVGSLFVQRAVLPAQLLPTTSAELVDDEDRPPASLRQASASGQIVIVSYNLYWWNVRQNNRWSQLYGRIQGARSFDLIGFQECSDVADVLQNSGLRSFQYYQGPTPNPAPIAWNPAVFTQLSSPGNKKVGEDRWGARHLTWVRLQHKATGAQVFFANTHGPLEQCGDALGNAWVSGINANKRSGDVVFMTGDFNCWTGTAAMNILKGQLTKSIDGGIDFILTDKGSVVSGGKEDGSPSDHPLIKGTFSLGDSSNPRRRRAPAAEQFRSGTSTCAPFSEWPSVDNGVTCGSCAALVETAPYGGSCDAYCKSFGHVCVGAAEEVDENCGIMYKASCQQAIADTSDMLCACQRQATVTPRRRRSSNSDAGVSNCAAYSQWPNVDNGVTCSGCTALVLTEPYGGRCDRYCESFGHTCVAAAEEEDENCKVKASVGCNEAVAETSDMLCTCQAQRATAPTPTPQPTSAQSAGCSNNNQQCNAWAAAGYCSSSPEYMLAYCKKACNACGNNGGNVNCQDYVAQCAEWAASGECDWSPTYMRSNCKRSCNVC